MFSTTTPSVPQQTTINKALNTVNTEQQGELEILKKQVSLIEKQVKHIVHVVTGLSVKNGINQTQLKEMLRTNGNKNIVL